MNTVIAVVKYTYPLGIKRPDMNCANELSVIMVILIIVGAITVILIMVIVVTVIVMKIISLCVILSVSAVRYQTRSCTV